MLAEHTMQSVTIMYWHAYVLRYATVHCCTLFKITCAWHTCVHPSPLHFEYLNLHSHTECHIYITYVGCLCNFTTNSDSEIDWNLWHTYWRLKYSMWSINGLKNGTYCLPYSVARMVYVAGHYTNIQNRRESITSIIDVYGETSYMEKRPI